MPRMMDDGQDFHRLHAQSIRHDVSSTGHDQLASTGTRPRPSDMRMACKALYGLMYPTHDALCGSAVVLADVSMDFVDVAERAAQPP
jgi:hypothetical protein